MESACSHPAIYFIDGVTLNGYVNLQRNGTCYSPTHNETGKTSQRLGSFTTLQNPISYSLCYPICRSEGSVATKWHSVDADPKVITENPFSVATSPEAAPNYGETGYYNANRPFFPAGFHLVCHMRPFRGAWHHILRVLSCVYPEMTVRSLTMDMVHRRFEGEMCLVPDAMRYGNAVQIQELRTQGRKQVRPQLWLTISTLFHHNVDDCYRSLGSAQLCHGTEQFCQGQMA